MNATKVKNGVTEGLPMVHTRDALLILGEMQHHKLSLRSNSAIRTGPVASAQFSALSPPRGRF